MSIYSFKIYKNGVEFMPWCPKCNIEYKEGITVCSDCNTILVDELSDNAGYVSFFMSEQKHVADKLKEYFEYSGVKSTISYSEEQEAYILSIPEEKQKQAKKLYQAFYFVERERLEQEARNKHRSSAASDITASDDEATSVDGEAIASDGEPADSDGEAVASDGEPADSDGEAANSDSKAVVFNGDASGFDNEAAVSGADNSTLHNTNKASATDNKDTGEDKKFPGSLTDEEFSSYDNSENTSDSEAALSDNDEALLEPDEGTENELPDEDIPVTSRYRYDSGIYVMKSEKYKEYSSTVTVFTAVGILGLVFVFMNVAGILSFLNGWLPNTVMGALFLFFIYIGLSTNKKAKTLRDEIEEENRLTEQINGWLKVNVTEEFLVSINDETKSDELNYILKTETIKEQLLKKFVGADPSYLDRLIEEYYNSNFDDSQAD